jgi:hypothetical protein
MTKELCKNCGHDKSTHKENEGYCMGLWLSHRDWVSFFPPVKAHKIIKAEARNAALDDGIKCVENLKLRMDNFSGDEVERSKYNQALKAVVRALESLKQPPKKWNPTRHSAATERNARCEDGAVPHAKEHLNVAPGQHPNPFPKKPPPPKIN